LEKGTLVNDDLGAYCMDIDNLLSILALQNFAPVSTAPQEPLFRNTVSEKA
jgi:hypothetical protein